VTEDGQVQMNLSVVNGSEPFLRLIGDLRSGRRWRSRPRSAGAGWPSRSRISSVRPGTQLRSRIHAVAADHGYDRSASDWTGPGRGWLAQRRVGAGKTTPPAGTGNAHATPDQPTRNRPLPRP
jgi:hypothetical protein